MGTYLVTVVEESIYLLLGACYMPKYVIATQDLPVRADHRP